MPCHTHHIEMVFHDCVIEKRSQFTFLDKSSIALIALIKFSHIMCEVRLVVRSQVIFQVNVQFKYFSALAALKWFLSNVFSSM